MRHASIIIYLETSLIFLITAPRSSLIVKGLIFGIMHIGKTIKIYNVKYYYTIKNFKIISYYNYLFKYRERTK